MQNHCRTSNLRLGSNILLGGPLPSFAAGYSLTLFQGVKNKIISQRFLKLDSEASVKAFLEVVLLLLLLRSIVFVFAANA
jgi:hypothetical protein